MTDTPTTADPLAIPGATATIEAHTTAIRALLTSYSIPLASVGRQAIQASRGAWAMHGATHGIPLWDAGDGPGLTSGAIRAALRDAEVEHLIALHGLAIARIAGGYAAFNED